MAVRTTLARVWRRLAEPRFNFVGVLNWRALLVAISAFAMAIGLAAAQVSQRPAKVGILWYLDPNLAAPYVGAFKKVILPGFDVHHFKQPSGWIQH